MLDLSVLPSDISSLFFLAGFFVVGKLAATVVSPEATLRVEEASTSREKSQEKPERILDVPSQPSLPSPPPREELLRELKKRGVRVRKLGGKGKSLLFLDGEGGKPLLLWREEDEEADRALMEALRTIPRPESASEKLIIHEKLYHPPKPEKPRRKRGKNRKKAVKDPLVGVSMEASLEWLAGKNQAGGAAW